MAEKQKLIYYGELKVPDGKYTNKEGAEKTRYISVGKVYHSPHMSRIAIYMYPTATTEGKWIGAYPDQNYQKPTENSQDDVIAEVGDEPINLDDIPF